VCPRLKRKRGAPRFRFLPREGGARFTMRILDRYLTRHLMIPVSFCSVTLISLVLIADVFDQLNDFVKNETPLLSISKYYLYLIPFAFVETIAWATLVGTIYLLVTSNTHNEILAMKASGLSISTITRPILYTGFLIGVTSFLVGNELLPATFRKAQAIKEMEISKRAGPDVPPETVIKNPTYYGLQNRLYYAKSFNPREQSFEDLIILFFSESRRVNRKIFCRRARWEGNAWKLFEVTDSETNTQGKILGEPRVYKERLYSELSEPPSAFIEAAREQYYLSYQNLRKHGVSYGMYSKGTTSMIMVLQNS
jgi:lipopolysaccharide export LptBFGC system permease protein LptF